VLNPSDTKSASENGCAFASSRNIAGGVSCCASYRANDLELTVVFAKGNPPDVGSARIWLLTDESIFAGKEFQ